jgi:hypothetical protein
MCQELAEGRFSKEQSPRQIVKTGGLMEYVSIPGKHGTDENTNKYDKLTVNLALWVLHILAGNHYKILREYPELPAKKLLPPIKQSNDFQQESHRKRPIEPEGLSPRKPYPQKRSKTDSSQDPIYLSYSGGLPLEVEV